MPVQPELPMDILRRKKSLAKEEQTLRLFLLLNTTGPRRKAILKKCGNVADFQSHGL